VRRLSTPRQLAEGSVATRWGARALKWHSHFEFDRQLTGPYRLRAPSRRALQASNSSTPGLHRDHVTWASPLGIREQQFLHLFSKLSYRERLLQNALLHGIELGRAHVPSHIKKWKTRPCRDDRLHCFHAVDFWHGNIDQHQINVSATRN